MIQRIQQQKSFLSKDAGFTLVESLVAIVVVSLLMAAIAPILVLSTATRVQSRRVELGAQVARAFIDGVRNQTIPIQSTATPPTLYISTISQLAAPTSTSPRNITSNTSDYLVSPTNMPVPDSTTKSNLYCFKTDGTIQTPDCSSSSNNMFYIQAGRIVQSTGTNDGYRLAVRIYRSDVDFTKSLKANTATTKNTQATVTDGLGDKQAPLLEITTDIGNRNTTFKALCKRLGTLLVTPTPTPTSTSTPTPTSVPCQ